MNTMFRDRIFAYIIGISCFSLMFTACIPSLVDKKVNDTVSESYNDSTSVDSVNSAALNWKEFFSDPYLDALIDTALLNNQELNIILQKINIAQNQIKARKGNYLPFLNIGAHAGLEKVGAYTRDGAVDQNLDIKPGQEIPEPLPNYMLSANVSWEVDIWKRLRNSKKAAVHKYLASIEGKNFMVTNLVSDIASAYYELMALDNQLEIIKQNIKIQENALKIVNLQKTAGMVTELAVRRFHAEVNKNKSRQYYIEQDIVETQNRINFLIGRYPQAVERSSENFSQMEPNIVYTGIPSQLLENRTDIKQAEQDLQAAKLDVKVAKANFYPTLKITGGVGYEAFNPKFLVNTPTSMLYNLAGGLVAPLVNRNSIKAEYLSANSRQIQAIYEYERTILEAYTEVVNNQAKINNLSTSFGYKENQVEALNRSINISLTLFNQARADYVEVLLTQRDALEAKMELIETKKEQMDAMVQMYQVLGGGWQ